MLKTKIAEQWELEKGFYVSRVGHHLLESDQLDNSDPWLALFGVDKAEALKLIAIVGFDLIFNTGLTGPRPISTDIALPCLTTFA
ncbi:MAG: hypothetical protein OXU36_10050 [Candidatus Poribacteria bacterium]|nr:hypothetical protein [Candidatus Poribacteria bacterium]